MVKLVLLFRRRRDLSQEEFLRYWKEDHVPLVRALPRLQRYVISVVESSPDREEPLHDGMAELWFDDEASLAESLASEQTAATAVDARNFLKRGSIHRFVMTEFEYAPMGSGGGVAE